MDDRVHTELWTSWASLLRSYAAAHGLNASQHAVIEVNPTTIVMRVGIRWLRFTAQAVQKDGHAAELFAIHEDGTVCVGLGRNEEMDMAAERFAREMLAAA